MRPGTALPETVSGPQARPPGAVWNERFGSERTANDNLQPDIILPQKRHHSKH